MGNTFLDGDAMVTTRRRFATLITTSLAACSLSDGVAGVARADDDEVPPNVFFSPPGRPFRALAGAPYPVVDWFRRADKNGDGKLDRDEFVADATAFFALLDLKGDGALDADEIWVYEHRIAPEVLGYRVKVYAGAGPLWAARGGVRLWLAQFGGGAGGSRSPQPQGGDPEPQAPTQPSTAADQASGASPYSFVPQPEPVTAADVNYLFSGVVRKDHFLDYAANSFTGLDLRGRGYLTLAGLPKTPAQKAIESSRAARRPARL